MFADVVIEYPVKSLDKCFTYFVPEKFKEIIKVGMKVVVPFGNNKLNGIVLTLSNNMPYYETKEILELVDIDFVLNDEQIALAKFLKEETLCPLISAFQTILPPALKIKTIDHNYNKYIEFVALSENANIDLYFEKYPKRVKQKDIIERLKKDKLLKKDISPSILKNFIENGLVDIIREKKYRINASGKNDDKKILNDEQQKVFDIVYKNINEHNIYLLHRVTGSGKSEVYMQLIDLCLNMGKSALVLVPEICLTTQTVERFYSRFGDDVAIFHSGLSIGEKYDEYQKIINKEVKKVVGTRSSIFVPLENLGIIIIDEEHSDTYKQDTTPRYNAKDVAIFRAKRHNIPVILASATPSLEAKARADKNVYKLLTLNKRANNMILPSCTLVDLKKENNTIISNVLKEKIIDRLNKKEQIILLLNRRGFSTFVTCSGCGYTYKCPNCDITLTYHKTNNNLRCHYCGYVTKKDEFCPECHENELNYLGLGTQKVQEEIEKMFTGVKVVRMDQDTTSKKGSLQKIIDDFGNLKYDILLGTQMISKGLDFKNVTLVGVINADTSLNMPDFRADEKTFSLLYQTSGRAGRDILPGEVIIQTYNPDNPVLNYVKNNDYNGFYLYEMNIRHILKYPPYTYMAHILVKSSSYEYASKHANNIKNYIEPKLDKTSEIFGPTPAGIFRINNVYHFQIIIKYTFDKNLKSVLKMIDDEYVLNKDVSVDITFNPSR